MWGKQGGTSVAPEVLADQAIRAGVEGVTLLGGEPFEQAEALAQFAALAQDGGLSVMAFTGHRWEDLRLESLRGASALLAHVDLLVDGPYQAEHLDVVRPWVGSKNQRFHFLSDRYRHLEHDLTQLSDRVEIRVRSTGEVTVNGWASVAQLDDLLEGSTSPIARGTVR